MSEMFLLGAMVLAQGCAMCRTALEGQTDSAVQALNLGVVILLVPPLAILFTILLIAVRQDREE